MLFISTNLALLSRFRVRCWFYKRVVWCGFFLKKVWKCFLSFLSFLVLHSWLFLLPRYMLLMLGNYCKYFHKQTTELSLLQLCLHFSSTLMNEFHRSVHGRHLQNIMENIQRILQNRYDKFEVCTSRNWFW